MKVSNCCGASPKTYFNDCNSLDMGFCPECKDNCYYIDACYECGDNLEMRMFDIDGTNLVEQLTCINVNCSRYMIKQNLFLY